MKKTPENKKGGSQVGGALNKRLNQSARPKGTTIDSRNTQKRVSRPNPGRQT